MSDKTDETPAIGPPIRLICLYTSVVVVMFTMVGILIGPKDGAEFGILLAIWFRLMATTKI